jgi:amino acid transporter, AAT family
LTVSFAVMLIGVVINYFIPERAFVYITSIATVCGLFVWGMIVVAHLGYRRRVEAGLLPKSEFQMPASPAGNWFVLLFLAMVLVMLGFNSDTRIGLYVTPAWVLILVVGYFASRSHHRRGTPATPPVIEDGPVVAPRDLGTEQPVAP